LRTKKTIDRDAVIDALTDRYYPAYRGYMDRDEMKKYFASIAGDLSEEKLTQSQIHVPKGSSSNSNPGSYTPDATVIPKNIEVSGPEGPVMTDQEPHATLNLMNFTNKQGRTAAPLTFRAGNEEVFMHPERLMKIDNGYFIMGKETGMPRTPAEKAAAAKRTGFSLAAIEAGANAVAEDPTSDEAQAAIQQFGTLQPRMIPLAGNESLLGTALNMDMDKAKAKLDAWKAPAKVNALPEVSSQAEYDKLPVGAKYMSGGKQYTKK
jgi:hypothetical protein